jgi:hypothetical protein
VIAGAPAALALTVIARIYLGNEAPLAGIFWLSLAAIVAATTAIAGRRATALSGSQEEGFHPTSA